MGRNRDFSKLTGPWIGLSVQGGFRLSEDIRLVIAAHRISGSGTDIDGNFDVEGTYDPESNKVSLTRRYRWVNRPSQEGVGIPFDYEGFWDGAIVSGFWMEREYPQNGGPFEMWPGSEEDLRELQIEAASEPSTLGS